LIFDFVIFPTVWYFIFGLKPIGQIAPNWVPRWSSAAVQVHTTTSCMFYREQLGSALPRAGPVYWYAMRFNGNGDTIQCGFFYIGVCTQVRFVTWYPLIGKLSFNPSILCSA
jgi:hypothetical protein